MDGANARQTRALQDDRGLRRWKVVAGLVTLLGLGGLFVTSLLRAPEDAWTAVLGVVTVAVAVLMVAGLVRSRRSRRR